MSSITDGEPTAHMENGEAGFSYLPTMRTLQETLKEVQRCTRDRITINTFMLEQSRTLTAFVEQMARINRGRAFFATPDRAGGVRAGGLRPGSPHADLNVAAFQRVPRIRKPARLVELSALSST